MCLQLPGIVPVFKESKSRIEVIRSEHPEIFDDRATYLNVLQIFENYSFKLTVRREVVRLFTAKAKLKTKTG